MPAPITNPLFWEMPVCARRVLEREREAATSKDDAFRAAFGRFMPLRPPKHEFIVHARERESVDVDVLWGV